MLEHLDFFYENYNYKMADMVSRINEQKPQEIDDSVKAHLGNFVQNLTSKLQKQDTQSKSEIMNIFSQSMVRGFQSKNEALERKRKI
mmetsp:Transcript_29399/g.44442  ORF Transcript_29399/g.44442 Transcript_29399/m.44442 type:complete len:87 (+) Transcript_29399:2880-3140(+)